MKAFVFSPSNLCIGKIEIEDVEDISHAIETFIITHPETKRLSYVECGPRVWTITNVSPFELQEGVVEEKPSQPSQVAPPAAIFANFRQSFSMFFFLLSFPLLIGASLALVATIVMWLHSGNWVVSESQLLLEENAAFRSWFESPKSWLGAHQLLSVVLKTPWSFALPALSFLLAILLDDTEARLRRRDSEKDKHPTS
jgi:hypothetical protein